MTTTDRLQGEGISMPDTATRKYTGNALSNGRRRAPSLGEGRERRECLTIADGYAQLADLIDAQLRQNQASVPKSPES